MVKKILLMVIVGLFISSIAYAGLFNKADSVVDFINNLEGKAGYIWLNEINEGGGQPQYVPQYSGSLYTFDAVEGDNSLFRIGSIDLAYVGGTKKFLVETIMDSSILKKFNLPLPFIGDLNLSTGLGLGFNFDNFKDNDYKVSKDGWIWGIPTIGFKANLKF